MRLGDSLTFSRLITINLIPAPGVVHLALSVKRCNSMILDFRSTESCPREEQYNVGAYNRFRPAENFIEFIYLCTLRFSLPLSIVAL